MEIWSKQVLDPLPCYHYNIVHVIVLAKVQQLLSHAHTWVQMTACKLFGRLFNTYKTVAKAITEGNSYLSVDSAKKVDYFY